ncbi:hypothetical protein [Erysipelothrix aquatica]|uniref:hypothetical protein n=1 Tax=Erysipelothrix aquatica TaxID=2683714 RepID=UPI00135C5D33|nr:hypothetical protein [Erysipelothrix aquatica]
MYSYLRNRHPYSVLFIIPFTVVVAMMTQLLVLISIPSSYAGEHGVFFEMLGQALVAPFIVYAMCESVRKRSLTLDMQNYIVGAGLSKKEIVDELRKYIYVLAMISSGFNSMLLLFSYGGPVNFERIMLAVTMLIVRGAFHLLLANAVIGNLISAPSDDQQNQRCSVVTLLMLGLIAIIFRYANIGYQAMLIIIWFVAIVYLIYCILKGIRRGMSAEQNYLDTDIG